MLNASPPVIRCSQRATGQRQSQARGEMKPERCILKTKKYLANVEQLTPTANITVPTDLTQELKHVLGCPNW